MRRLMASALMTALLLGLAGCGSGKALEEKIDTLRLSMAEAEELAFTADVETDLGDETFACTLRCTAAGDETVLEVLEPELVAGVTARFDREKATLEFDGVELSVGMTQGGYTPMTAVPAILGALLSGHVTQVWTESGEETELAAARTYLDETSSVLLWFEEESMTPVYAELVIGDTAVIQCGIRDLTMG